MGSSSQDPVVYGFKLGMHHVVCHSDPSPEVIELQEIIADKNKIAWSGSVTSSQTIQIDNKNLFGGEEKEGGIKGVVDVMFGDSTQAANAYLTANTSGPQPGYRGVFSTVWNQVLMAINNPYIKEIAYVLKRTWGGWYPLRESIANGGVNPAHIIYQCLTNRAWGLGYPSTNIDETAFIAAADALFDEGFGLCFTWMDSSSIEEFMQQVLDHCGGILSINPATGQFTLKLIRDDYDPNLIPAFENGINTTLVDYQRQGWGDTINKLTLKYHDISTWEDRPIVAYDRGNIRAQGRVVSHEVTYAGIPNQELASTVILRDLRARCTPLAILEIEFDRIGWSLRPGDVFKFTSAEHGFSDMVVRIGRISLGSLEEGKIVVSAVQDIFSLSTATFTVAEPPAWVPISKTPVEPLYQSLFEGSYWYMYQRLGEVEMDYLTALDTYIGAIGSRPPGLNYSYHLYSQPIGQEYTYRDKGSWAPTFQLNAAVGQEATSTLDVTIISDADVETVEGNLAGEKKLALLGDELVWVTAIDLVLSTVEVTRAVVDTVPVAHVAGELLQIMQGFSANDPVKYVDGETIRGKLLTYAADGLLALSSATQQSIIVDARQNKPYPPGNIRINGVFMPATFSGEATLSWAHRDRLLQIEITPQSQVAPDIGPEVGTTYTLQIYGDGGTLLRTETGLTGTSYTYLTADEIADGGGVQTQLRFVIWAVRDALDSWQSQDITSVRV